MRIAVTVKSIAKRKPVLAKQTIELPETTNTLRQLIEHTVAWQIQKYKDRQEGNNGLAYLLPESIDDQAYTGKVSFGTINRDGMPDVAEASAVALTAYKDGLYRVFLNEQELEQLDELLPLEEGDELVFIRLTMLAGRLW